MISREQKITQSVQDYVRAALAARGYGGEVDFEESWEGIRRDGLSKTTITSGFDFDDEGTQAEMGSDLKVRLYTVQFVVFGTTEVWAKNLASVIKFAIDEDGAIPLMDIEADPPVEIDRLEVVGVSTERQGAANPEPWNEHVWSCTARLQDTYHARLAA